MLPISPPRRTKVSALSWKITLSRRDDFRGHIREPQYFSPKEPTLERSRFRSVPRQIALNLLELPNQVIHPNFTIGLPEGFQNYTSKTYQSGAFSYPRKYFAQLQTFHPTLHMLMINIRETVMFRQFCDRRSTTRTTTLRVAYHRS